MGHRVPLFFRPCNRAFNLFDRLKPRDHYAPLAKPEAKSPSAQPIAENTPPKVAPENPTPAAFMEPPPVEPPAAAAKEQTPKSLAKIFEPEKISHYASVDPRTISAKSFVPVLCAFY